MNLRVIIDADVIVNRYVRMKTDSRANFGILSNHYVRPDEYAITYACSWIDDRGRMNRRLDGFPGMENNHRVSESQVRIFRPHHREIGSLDFHIFADKDG